MFHGISVTRVNEGTTAIRGTRYTPAMTASATPVNLNAPCPCGSGRKYKRCCHAAQKAEQARARAARQGAANAVMRFAEQRAPGGYVRCREAVLAPLRERLGPTLVQDVAERVEDLLLVNLVDSFIADQPLEDGRTPIELFLANPASEGLHPTARTHLESWAAASLSLYEVEEIEPGEGLTLKDLLSGELVRVAERTASQRLSQWDVVVTRPVASEAGLRIAAGIYFVPREAVPWLRGKLDEDRAAPQHEGLSWPEYLKRRWALVPQLWLELLAGVPPLAHDHECDDPDCDHHH